jgi:fibronectin-binding autotransporter adhesin
MNAYKLLRSAGSIFVFGLIGALSLQPAAANTYTWDSGGNYGSGPTDGAGAWNVTGSNWYGLGPSDQAWVNANNDTAVFGVGSGGSAAEAVSISTVGTGIQAGGVTFNNQNYTLSSSTLTLGGATPNVTVNAAAATINSVLAGSAGMVKSGTGLLTLGGANPGFNGGTTISQGTLQLNTANAAGTSALITLGDANTGANNVALNINIGSNTTLANPIVISSLGSGSATINYLSAITNVSTLSGALTMNGPVTMNVPAASSNVQMNAVMSGSGQLTVGNTNATRFIFLTAEPNYTGNIVLNSNGVFEPRGSLTAPNGNNITVNSGGELRIQFASAAIAALNGTGLVDDVSSAATLSLGAGNASGSFTGTMKNNGATLSFTKTGTGTQVLSGGNIGILGPTTLTQGTLNLTNAPNFASTVTMNASNTVDLQLGSTGSSTWTFGRQILTGGANSIIEKVGPGTVLLNPAASSTFVGSSTAALTVTAGNLYLNSPFSTAPAVSVSSIGTFGGSSSAAATTVATGGGIVGGYNGAGTLTLSSLTYSGSGAIQGTLSATVTPIVVNGAVTAGGGAASIDVTANNSLGNGTYHFVKYTGTDPFNDFTLATPSRVLSLVDNAGYIDINVNTSAYPIWTGLSSSDWSTLSESGAKNWVLNTTGSATDFLVGDNVLFNDAAGTLGGPGGTNVTINNGNVLPGSTTFSNNAYNYTISGANGIASGSLLVNGTGSVTINTANTYAGGTTLASGSIIFGNNAALGGGAVTVSGGTLDLHGFSPSIGALSGTGGVIASNGGSPGTLTVTNAGTTTFSGIIANNTDGLGGTMALVQGGTGTLVLTNTNTFSGQTSLNAGAVQLGIANALPNSAVAINSTNALTFSAGLGTANIAGLGGSSNEALADSAGHGVLLNVGGNNASTVYNGVLSGTGGALTKTGSGMLTLGGANSYGGSTTISQGTLQFNAAPAASGSGTITLGDANTGGNSVQFNIGNNVAISNSILVANQGGGTNTIKLNSSGNFSTGSGTITLNAPLTLDGSGITGPNYLLFYHVLSGTGTLTIPSTNGYRLIWEANAPNFTGNFVVGSNAIFEPRGALTSTTGNDVTMQSGGTLYETGNFGTITIGGLNGNAGTVTAFNAAGAISIGKGNDSGSFSGTISNGTGLSISKTGTGTQIFSGPNITYTGPTTLTQGTLTLTDVTNFASAVTANSGNLVDLQLSTTSSTDNWTFNRQINGGSTSAIIEKVGPGTVLLTPAGGSTFLGSSTAALTVSGGSLYLNGAFSTAPAVSVGPAGTFGGISSAGATTVAQGGGIVGGYNGSGSLTLSSLTYAGSGTIQGPLSLTNIPIVVAGAVTAGSASIAITPANLPADGTYHFLQYGGVSDPFSDFTLPVTTIGRTVVSLIDNSGSELIDINFNTSAYPIWTGLAGGDWSFNTEPGPKNWVLNVGGATDFLNNDKAVFNDSVGTAGTTNVTINNGNVTPASTTFNNNAYNYTISGSNGIASGSLAKNGTGVLTILNSNSYSGGTTVTSGTLSFANGALGSGNINLNGAPTLQWNGGNTQDISSQLAIGNLVAATLDTQGNNVTLASSFGAGSSGSIIKVGTGMLTLGGANGFTGGVTVSQGTLTASFATANLGGNTNPLVQVDNGTTLNLIGAGSVTDGAAITLAAGSTLSLSVTSAGNSLLSQPVEVTGNATINLSHNGSPNRGNGFILNSTVPVNVTVNGGGGTSGAPGWDLGGDYGYDRGATAAGALAAGSTVLFNGTAGSASSPAALYVTTAVGRAALANADVIIGSTNANSNVAILIAGNTGGTFQVNSLAGGSNLTYFASDNFASVIQINNGTATGASFAGGITNGAGSSPQISLVKSGTGTQILGSLSSITTATSSFTGNITVNGGTLVAAALSNGTTYTALGAASNARTFTINAGGTLQFDAPNVFGNNFATSAPTLAISGGIVTNADPANSGAINNALNNVNLTGGTLTATTGFHYLGELYGAWDVNGTITSSGNSLISTSDPVNGTVFLNSVAANAFTTTFNVASGTLTISAPLAQDNVDSIVSSLNLTGAGLLLLTASNSYTGGTAISGGTLQLGNKNALGSGALAANGGVLDLAGYSVAVPSFGGASGVVTNSGGTLSTLTVSQSIATNFGGTLADGPTNPLSLFMNGAGTLTLLGANSYSGPTTVHAGTLMAGAANALSASSAVTVELGGTLEVTGGLQTVKALTIGATGTLNVNDLYPLSVSGTASFVSGSSIDIITSGIVTPDLLMTYTASAGTLTNVYVNGALGLPGGDSLSYSGGSLEIVSAAAGAVWNNGAGGSWTTPGNWTPSGVPSGGTVTFPELGATSAITVNLDGPQSAGALVFSASEGYVLAAGNSGTLTLSNSASITVLSGTHTISAPVEIAGGGLDIAASNSSSLTISGNIADDGLRSLTLDGDGTGQLVLSGANTYGGATIVNAGTLVVDTSTALPDRSSLFVGQGASSAFSFAPAVSVPAGVVAVPEPGTLALVLAALIVGILQAVAMCRTSKQRDVKSVI